MRDLTLVRRPFGNGKIIAGSLLLTTFLASCSVPNSVNPAKWFGPDDAKTADAGKSDYPKLSSVPDAPKTLSPDEREDLREGLVADKARARASGEQLKREGSPTRPLGPAQAPAQAPTSAQSAVVPAERTAAPQQPAVTAPVPAPAQVSPAQTPTAPQAPQSRQIESRPGVPAIASEVPPPPPSGLAQSAVDESYRRRLAESAGQSPVADPPRGAASSAVALAASAPPPPAASTAFAQAPVLTPPWERKSGKSAAAPAAAAPAIVAPQGGGASTQLGTVIFAEGSSKLTSDSRAMLREVADAQRDQGGLVRIVGHGTGAVGANAEVGAMMRNFDLAMRRADVVAAELRKLGVPAESINVSAETDADAVAISRGARTEIFLDY